MPDAQQFDELFEAFQDMRQKDTVIYESEAIRRKLLNHVEDGDFMGLEQSSKLFANSVSMSNNRFLEARMNVSSIAIRMMDGTPILVGRPYPYEKLLELLNFMRKNYNWQFSLKFDSIPEDVKSEWANKLKQEGFSLEDQDGAENPPTEVTDGVPRVVREFSTFPTGT